MKRSVSVPSDRNMSFHFDKLAQCVTSLQLCREFEKEIENMARAIPLGWSGLIGKCRSILLGYSYWSLTAGSGIMKTPQVTDLI